MSTTNTRTELSMAQLVQTEFEQCGVRFFQPFQNVEAMQRFKDDIDNNPEAIGPMALVARNYAGFAVASAAAPEQRETEITDWGRRLTASVGVAVCLALGRQVTLDPLINKADREQGSGFNDTEALRVVEALGQKLQDAEKKIAELQRANDESELSKMQLEENLQTAARDKQQLQEELQKTQKALGDAHAQAPQSQDPVVAGVVAELRKFQADLSERWINAIRERVREQHAAADRVNGLLKMIQIDPAIMEAVQKNPLIAPAFEVVSSVVREIPA